jgi:hypothetical protein
MTNQSSILENLRRRLAVSRACRVSSISLARVLDNKKSNNPMFHGEIALSRSNLMTICESRNGHLNFPVWQNLFIVA